MNAGFRAELARLDSLISRFEKVVQEFPKGTVYANVLAKLKKERAELTNSIGRK